MARSSTQPNTMPCYHDNTQISTQVWRQTKFQGSLCLFTPRPIGPLQSSIRYRRLTLYCFRSTFDTCNFIRQPRSVNLYVRPSFNSWRIGGSRFFFFVRGWRFVFNCSTLVGAYWSLQGFDLHHRPRQDLVTMILSVSRPRLESTIRKTLWANDIPQTSSLLVS